MDDTRGASEPEEEAEVEGTAAADVAAAVVVLLVSFCPPFFELLLVLLSVEPAFLRFRCAASCDEVTAPDRWSLRLRPAPTPVPPRDSGDSSSSLLSLPLPLSLLYDLRPMMTQPQPALVTQPTETMAIALQPRRCTSGGVAAVEMEYDDGERRTVIPRSGAAVASGSARAGPQ